MFSDIVILGCGWAGVSIAYNLLKKIPNVDIVCIEASTNLGGLLRTEIINGFVFDIAGSHVIFSKDKYVLKSILSFLSGNVIEHKRNTYINLNGLFIPYPFENGIYVMPPDVRANILVSFIEALINNIKRHNSWKPKNLREWIYSFFGKEMARLYLEPYNLKVWKRPLERIDIDWVYVPGRMPVPDWRDVVRSGAGVPTEGYREQARFYYPLKGGIQSLYQSLLKRALDLGLKVIKGWKVRKIRKQGNKWIIDDKITAHKLVSTIPLNELVIALDAPEYIVKLSKRLDYNSVVIVGVALRKKAPNMHWVYVPDKNIIFHRYAWLSNYSPHNVPATNTYSSILVEVTVPPREKVDKDKMLDHVIDGLERLGVIERSADILFTKVWYHKYAYPLHTIESNRSKYRILEYLREKKIMSLGRWGSWQYMNMDRVYAECAKIANSFVQ